MWLRVAAGISCAIPARFPRPAALPFHAYIMGMRAFGIFRDAGQTLHGEVSGDEVRLLKRPYWLGIEESGLTKQLRDLEILPPVAPSKVIAVGLNYAEHIAEMKRTPLGTPLIWFK